MGEKMKVKIITQVVLDLPDKMWGFIDPFTITINKVHELIKSGESRKLLRTIPHPDPKQTGVTMVAEIQGEIVDDAT